MPTNLDRGQWPHTPPRILVDRASRHREQFRDLVRGEKRLVELDAPRYLVLEYQLIRHWSVGAARTRPPHPAATRPTAWVNRRLTRPAPSAEKGAAPGARIGFLS